MVPADPAAHLVLIQAQLALALQNRRLDRPAHATHPDQRRVRCLGGGIGQVRFELGWLAAIACLSPCVTCCFAATLTYIAWAAIVQASGC